MKDKDCVATSGNTQSMVPINLNLNRPMRSTCVVLSRISSCHAITEKQHYVCWSWRMKSSVEWSRAYKSEQDVFALQSYILAMYIKKSPEVGLEPATIRLKTLRFTDWAKRVDARANCKIRTTFFHLRSLSSSRQLHASTDKKHHVCWSWRMNSSVKWSRAYKSTSCTHTKETISTCWDKTCSHHKHGNVHHLQRVSKSWVWQKCHPPWGSNPRPQD